MKYEKAFDVEKIAREVVFVLAWGHIFLDDVAFIRSFGSKSRGTIARCHALGKAMQIGMNRRRGFYLIEVISERFDKLSEEERVKVVIHELMHIPKSFGGGFIHHDKVTERNVDRVYDKFISMKEKRERWF